MKKAKNIKKPAQNHWGRLLLITLTILLILCTYLTILRNNVSTGANAFVFLKEAKVFVVTTDIVKAEIAERLPDDIKKNYIKNTVASRLLDVIITPESVAKVAEPSINAAYRVAKEPTKISNNQVVLETDKYKNQALEFIPTIQLPGAITDVANRLVGSIPDQLTLIDLQKRPNSILATFIQIRDTIRTISNIVNILWVLVVVNILLLIAVNIKTPGRILRTISWVLGVTGLVIVIGSYIFAPIINIIFLQNIDTISGNSLNTLTSNIANHYFLLTRGYGWLYIATAVVAYIAFWFISSERPKELFASNYNKFKQTINIGKSKTHHKS